MNRIESVGLRCLRLLCGTVLLFGLSLFASRCGTNSKWVGTYKVKATAYSKQPGGRAADDGTWMHTYYIGDIPYLYVCERECFNSYCTCWVNRTVTLADTPDRLVVFSGEAKYETNKYLESWAQYSYPNGHWSHSDLIIGFYADKQTSESLYRRYYSFSEQYDLSATGETYQVIGTYTRTNTQDRDCRKLKPPCE